MKKAQFWKLILMLLPIGAVGLATAPVSVMVFDTGTGGTAYHSYFELIDVGTLKMAAPLAAVMSLVSGILAAVYLGMKKTGCLKAVRVTAFLAACFAVLPVLLQSQVKVLPNPVLPLLMLGQAVLAHFMVKQPADQGEQCAPRLGGR